MIEKVKLTKSLYLLSIGIAIVIHLFSFSSGLSDLVDNKIYNQLTRMHFGHNSNDLKTTIVEIDTKSINELGQWPWSRLIIAKLIQNIQNYHPASIGIDIIFAEQDRTSPKILEKFYKQNLNVDANFSSIPNALQDNDIILSHTISKSNIATSIIATDKQNESTCRPKNFITFKSKKSSDFLHVNNFICNTANIQNNIQNSGFINAHLSEDGFLRKYVLVYKYQDKLIPSLGVAMLKSVDKNIYFQHSSNILKPSFVKFLDHTMYLNSKGEVLNYTYPPSKFKTISAIDVLHNDFDPNIFLGKFVIIGATATGLSSFYISQEGKITNGLFSHASFIENVLYNTLLHTPQFAKYIVLLLSFVFTVLIIYTIIDYNYIYSIIAGGMVALIIILINHILMEYGIYVPYGHLIVPFLLSCFFAFSMIIYISQKRERELNEQVTFVRSSITNNIMNIIETRDSETGNHIIRTKEFAKALALHLYKSKSKYSSELSKNFINNIYHATPLHDIGKIGIPDHILQKPGKLTEEEMDIMKSHPKIGHDILYQSLQKNFDTEFFQTAINIIYTHHEKWDGTGYPNALKEEEIPLEGRIVALCDVYDALTTKRYYKEAFSFEKSKRIIIEGKGTHFDPVIVDSFLKIENQFKKIADKYKDN